jgi:periplasmic divalent cation tolerance protein
MHKKMCTAVPKLMQSGCRFTSSNPAKEYPVAISMSHQTSRIVLTTIDSADAAQRLAQVLVERRLAACVNLLPGLTSIYRWQGAVETASEILLLIKTEEAQLPSLEAALHELHPYELPEFLVLSVESGSKLYLQWLHDSLMP